MWVAGLLGQKSRIIRGEAGKEPGGGASEVDSPKPVKKFQGIFFKGSGVQAPNNDVGFKGHGNSQKKGGPGS